MDFLWALGFLLWYEVLSWPLRGALDRTRAPADVRRLLSRLAGPALFVLPVWGLAHLWGGALGRGVGVALVATAGLAVALHALHAGHVRRALGYDGNRGVALDLLTVALFFAFVAFRRWVPEMTAFPIDSSAAEKFMNSMIFWSSWHAPGLPPEDYWLSGHPLTYYYWGHFHWAWVGRVGAFPAELALNLGFARLVTAVFEGGVLLARAVGLPLRWALVAGVAVAWAGNPQAVSEAVAVWKAPPAGYDWAAYDYWKPSRAIADSVISEFPAFSAILGDFHAHHLALPWWIAWLALVLGGARWFAGGGRAVAAIAFGGLALAATFSNLWNLPVLVWALVLAIGWAVLDGRGGAGTLAGLGGLTVLLAIAGARLLLGGEAQPLPSDAEGGFAARLPVGWLPGALRSTPGQLFAMWGWPLLAVALAAGARAWRERDARPWLAAAAAVALAAALDPVLTPLGWVATVLALAALSAGPRPWLSPAAGLLGLGACAVLLGIELLFVDDAYTGPYERYNSYFKLSYPAWPAILVVATAAARSLWRGAPRGIRAGLRGAIVGLALAALVYPALAVPSRLLKAWHDDDPPRTATLDAVDFLRHRPPYAEESEMLEWIRTHVAPGQAVAEGVGNGAYGYVGRVASLAGRPVPLGWAHHERQWRGLPGHVLTERRAREIDAFYRAADPGEMRRRAAELGLSWALYGRVERQRYGGEAVLEQLQTTAPVAAAFPASDPQVFLFDFRLGATP